MKLGKVIALLLMFMAVTFFIIGFWLVASPHVRRLIDAEFQDALLDSITARIDEISGYGENNEPYVINGPCEDGVYDEVGEAETTGIKPVQSLFFSDIEQIQVIHYAVEPIIEPIYIPEPLPALYPLDYSAFPRGIDGIGILTIERLDIRLPVMNGTDETKLRLAIGRVPQTAAIGEIGNAVIAGHRNFAFGSMFNRLDEAAIGDIIEFQALNGEIIRFKVFEILIIHPSDQVTFIQPQDISIITLYTCTPVREATHRLIVRAEKI